jgi:hypothetical protein
MIFNRCLELNSDKSQKTRRYTIYMAVFFTILLNFSCVDDVSIKLKDSTPRLVVSGFLITQHHRQYQIINLSKSSNYSDTSSEHHVNSAFVQIESNSGHKTYCPNIKSGQYFVFIKLSQDSSYRLLIETKEGRKYETDFQKAPDSVKIDSIYFFDFDYMQKNAFLFTDEANPTEKEKLYHAISFKDPKGTENYYTYRNYYNGGLFGNLENMTLLGPKDILDGSTIKPEYLWFKEFTSRIETDVTVEQISIDKASYQYYKQLKNLFEKAGTPFASPPSNPISNIRCTSHKEEVIGYFTIGSSTKLTATAKYGTKKERQFAALL